MRQKTKAELKSDYSHSLLKPVSSSRYQRRNRTSEARPASGSQLQVLPIPNLESAMDTRERRVAEKNEKDRLEEILREKEKDAARNESSATPMPSINGDEWTPSETDMEPDLRDKLNETKRIRPCDCEGEGPDLREAMIKRRVEKAKVPRSPSPDPEGEIGTLYYGPDTAETGGDFLPGFYCRCCEPNKHFMVQDDLRTHEQEPDSSQS